MTDIGGHTQEVRHLTNAEVRVDILTRDLGKDPNIDKVIRDQGSDETIYQKKNEKSCGRLKMTTKIKT